MLFLISWIDFSVADNVVEFKLAIVDGTAINVGGATVDDIMGGFVEALMDADNAAKDDAPAGGATAADIMGGFVAALMDDDNEAKDDTPVGVLVVIDEDGVIDKGAINEEGAVIDEATSADGVEEIMGWNAVDVEVRAFPCTYIKEGKLDRMRLPIKKTCSLTITFVASKWCSAGAVRAVDGQETLILQCLKLLNIGTLLFFISP